MTGEPVMPDPKADDNVATEDNVELILRGPDGQIKQIITAHNLVTTAEEAGIFAASTSGSMYARPAFEVINVGAGDSLEIKLTLEYT
jgi:hypothetical protein